MMYYTATSVIEAIAACPMLKIRENTVSCPKKYYYRDCRSFPDCSGKEMKCEQTLRLVNINDAPINIKFYYYTDKNSRDGRIKKWNQSLTMIIEKYHLDTSLFKSI